MSINSYLFYNFTIECTCAGEKPANFMDENFNVTKTFIPLATNGQVFPWNNIRLPKFVKPTRYNITIHPNLTTLEVKGKYLFIFLISLIFLFVSKLMYVTTYFITFYGVCVV